MAGEWERKPTSEQAKAFIFYVCLYLDTLHLKYYVYKGEQALVYSLLL